MTEAKLTQAEGGWLEPEGDGWYVLNAQDAKWLSNEMGGYCSFEGQERFPEFGLNLNSLPPGAPMAMYHHEPYQEGFLVLDGEAVLIIEGEERTLRRWDYVHCPRDVPHVIVGGPEGALVLAVGSRTGPRGVGYPVDETALKHGAGVEVATSEQSEAYAKFSKLEASTAREEFLPG
jgi:quercetin dioxygenase-like cupin family protein